LKFLSIAQKFQATIEIFRALLHILGNNQIFWVVIKIFLVATLMVEIEALLIG
jgi:hypothetical protein